MRIVYDHQIFAVQRHGGISRYYYELASRMPAAWEVSVAAPLHINEYLEGGGVRVDGLRIPAFRGAPRLTGIVGRAVQAGRPDIVHETYYGPAGFPGARRRVTTLHDMIPEILGQGEVGLAEKKLAAIKRADAVICISDTTRNDLLARVAIDPAKVRVIPLAGSLAPSNRTITGSPFILFVGQRHGYKNFLALLRAYASSSLTRDFRMICFGGGPFTRDERDELRRLSLPEDRVVQLTGDDDLLAAHYQAAALYVCPSLYEGFGLPIVEAMALGSPVCCSDAGSLPEVAGGAARLFDPSDVDAMRETLETLCHDAGARRDLTERGRLRAAQFSWDATAQATADLYRSL